MLITLDDLAPTFTWWSENAGDWASDHRYSDAEYVYYFDQTFHSTAAQGATVSLSFNGSAVTVYGSKWYNHGEYSAQLDSSAAQYFSGYSPSREIQAVIYRASELDTTAEHTLTLTNLPNASTPSTEQWYFDMDYVVIDNGSDEQVSTSTFDDTDSDHFQYSSSDWTTQTDNTYNEGSAHTTNLNGATVTVSFSGSSCQVFGSLDVDHSNYSVSLDGGDVQVFNGNCFVQVTGIPLYTVSGLADTQHSIVFTNLSDGSDTNAFDVDYIVVNSTSASFLTIGPSTTAAAALASVSLDSMSSVFSSQPQSTSASMARDTSETNFASASSSISPAPAGSTETSAPKGIFQDTGSSAKSTKHSLIIAAGVICGLGLCLALGAYLAWGPLRRRRRQRESRNREAVSVESKSFYGFRSSQSVIFDGDPISLPPSAFRPLSRSRSNWSASSEYPSTGHADNSFPPIVNDRAFVPATNVSSTSNRRRATDWLASLYAGIGITTLPPRSNNVSGDERYAPLDDARYGATSTEDTASMAQHLTQHAPSVPERTTSTSVAQDLPELVRALKQNQAVSPRRTQGDSPDTENGSSHLPCTSRERRRGLEEGRDAGIPVSLHWSTEETTTLHRSVPPDYMTATQTATQSPLQPVPGALSYSKGR